MEPIYIISIAIGGVFVVLFLIFILLYAKKRKAEKLLKEELDEAYSDPNLAKMEYDIAFYDEEIQNKINAMNPKTDKQVTIEDVIRGETNPTPPPEEDALFAKIDDEGMEEISGNYRSDGQGNN